MGVNADSNWLTMNDWNQAHVILISIEIIIADANSLKARRAVLNRIKDRVKSRFNASVAEVGDLEKWQRATVAVSMVSNEKKKLQQDADKLREELLSMTDTSINEFVIEWL